VKGVLLKYVTLNQCKLHVQRKAGEEVGGEGKEEEGRASEGDGDQVVVEGGEGTCKQGARQDAKSQARQGWWEGRTSE
jgi:hypothetical protein